jgi:predicted DsbA family dithiol-disulfide isomerase
VQEMCVRLVPVGKKVHIDFKFDEALIYNTQDAHRLIQWSKTFDKSIALEKGLLHAYFCDGIDLSMQKNLLKIIEDVGLDCAKAKEIIEKEEFSEEINLDIERAKSLGVRGVPFFLINEKTAVSGYQEDGEFEKLLSNALSR